MMTRNCVRVAGLLVVAGLMFAALTVTGCASTGLHRVNNLPGEQRLVGGGIMISWKAPEAGTVYLVEKKTRKLIETRSLDEGDVFDFKVESTVDAEELGNMLGINFSKAEFLLYFKPAGQ